MHRSAIKPSLTARCLDEFGFVIKQTNKQTKTSIAVSLPGLQIALCIAPKTYCHSYAGMGLLCQYERCAQKNVRSA